MWVEIWHTHSEMGITAFWSESLKVRGYVQDLCADWTNIWTNVKERSCNDVDELFRLRIWSSGGNLIKNTV